VALREQHRAMAYRGGEQSPYAHGLSIGLDSGQVVFGGLGGPELGRLDYTVLGDVTNNAAQLAAMAKRNQLLIPEYLRPRVSATFECRAMGSHLLSASGASVPVFNVVGRYGELRSSDDHTTVPEVADKPTPPLKPGMASLTGR
jgi:class 3 adenylate cyclase